MRIEKEIQGMKMYVDIPDEDVKQYAITKLGMIVQTNDIVAVINAGVECRLNEMIRDEPGEILDLIGEDDIRDFVSSNYDMMTPDEFADEWYEWVDDIAIEDYARDQFNMMTEDEAAEWAKEKLDG